MNAKLGNVGKTVFYTDTVETNPANQAESLKDLAADMRGSKVDLLIILGGNPAYDAPADLNFADAMTSGKVSLRVHHGLYQNAVSYTHLDVYKRQIEEMTEPKLMVMNLR